MDTDGYRLSAFCYQAPASTNAESPSHSSLFAHLPSTRLTNRQPHNLPTTSPPYSPLLTSSPSSFSSHHPRLHFIHLSHRYFLLLQIIDRPLVVALRPARDRGCLSSFTLEYSCHHGFCQPISISGHSHYHQDCSK